MKDEPHFAGGDERPAGPAVRAQRLALDEGGARRVRGGQGLRRAERQPRRTEVERDINIFAVVLLSTNRIHSLWCIRDV